MSLSEIPRPRHAARLAALLVGSTAWLGCTHIPEGQRAITSFEIKGTQNIDIQDLEGKIATQATSRFFGLFRGIVFEYEVYDRYALERDLARIERYYRARGYYGAKVRAARVLEIGPDKVAVEIHVHEGEPVRVRLVEVEWIEPVPEPIRLAVEAEVRAAAVGPRGVFDEEIFAQGGETLVRALANRGYAAAESARDADVDLVENMAIVRYRVVPGEPSVFGEISFEGSGEIPVDAVRRTFAVKPGADYSAEALDEGRQALLDLGVFATVDVETDLESDEREASGRGRRLVPVKVKLELGKLRGVRAGGGVEFNSTRLDLHVVLGWRSENLLGGLRRLDVTFRPGVVLYPTSINTLVWPEKLLFFQQTRAQFRKPGFLEPRTAGVVTGDYSVFPQLLPQAAGTEFNVIGYHTLSTNAGLERNFGRLFLRPSYGFQANFPYDAVGTAPEPLESVLVSYVELLSYLDFRDNPLRPTRGTYFGNTFQFAGGPIGGNAGDFRVQPEARAFVRLSRRVSLAMRAGVGFVFPRDYAAASQQEFRAHGSAEQAALSHDYQILFFRGLFGGGPSSNRGYPLRGVGPHDTIPYLIPAVRAQQATLQCDPSDPDPPRECLLPTGGLSQWETSVELRFDVSGPILAALFCDAGDVSPFEFLSRAPDGSIDPALRFDRPHVSCGGGGRYDTPVGPIRLDLGFRIPGLQTLGSSSGEGIPSTPFNSGIPMAISFGIGEAF